jgi:CP family cyanate transporter-like MFS transporter
VVSLLRSREPRAASFVLLGLGVVLVASNLRPAVASVGPLLHRIEVGEGLSNAAASALSTLPVLCYAVVAPAAPLLARRLGSHAAVAAALGLLLAGQLIRLITGVEFLFLGTALAGAAIAIGNVLMPVMVRRDFTDHAGVAMSVFSTCLMGFAALAAGVSVPVANALGGGWRPGTRSRGRSRCSLRSSPVASTPRWPGFRAFSAATATARRTPECCSA